MTDYKFDQDTAPSDGDVLTWNTTANRIRWTELPSSPALASTIIKIPAGAGDGGVPVIYSTPAGSYIGGHGTLTGGGLSTVTMAEGVIYGPTSGADITISGTEGEYFILSKPV
tara:strand:- start:3356 stop:3694 length:339 start_codon:yes stop_codon:yes gene_type:complete